MASTYLDEISGIVGRKVVIQRHDAGRIYVIKIAESDIEVASFCLKQLAGCCGMCVSYHVEVVERFRNKGIGTLLNKMRQQIAWDDGYSVLLCTDVKKNKPQQRILEKNEWKKLISFKNRRTKNKVCMHAIKLEKTGMKVGTEIDLSPPK